jgi:hypothetical protein
MCEKEIKKLITMLTFHHKIYTNQISDGKLQWSLRKFWSKIQINMSVVCSEIQQIGKHNALWTNMQP